MVKTLIAQQWKETRRSPVWQKNLAVNILLGFFILYFLVAFGLLGIFMKEILMEMFPNEPVVTKFNGFILYYAVFDVFSRFYLQEVPILSIQPYLHLPIKKGRIVHYLLGKSVLSFFNFFPLLFFVPFGVRVVAAEYSALGTVAWFVSILAIMFFNNFLAVYLKKQMVQNFRLFVAIGLTYVLVIILDYLGVFSFQKISAIVFNLIGEVPLIAIGIVAFPVVMYFLNYQFLASNTYIEEISTKKKANSMAFSNTEFLDRFGEVGKYIGLELKLIWRNKRTKSVAQMSTLLLFYGLIFYTQDLYVNNYGWITFVGVFITGLFMINYGQFILGWESSYFDGILSKNIDPYQYFLAKFWLMVPLSAVAYLISLLYGFFGTHIMLVHTMAFLYNIGINVFVILYASTFNKKKIDLQKKAAFNWQGTGATQFVLVLPLLAAPILLFLPFILLDMEYLGMAVISGLSLISLSLSKVWFRLIVKRFVQEKYKMAAGFRRDD